MSSGTLDIEDPVQLVQYLRATRRIDACETPTFHTLAGGVSNRTVLVRRGGGETDWVIKQALAKLRTTANWFSDPSRAHREALGIEWLGKLAPPGSIPQLVFEDPAEHLIAMEAVPQPHENWKMMLLRGEVEAGHVEQFARLLAAIHGESAARCAQIEPIFADTSFFESLRLEPYYLYTAQQVPPAHDFLHRLVHDTRRRKISIVHGDYSPKNILVHDGRLILLDHEVIHWGDPAFDAGFSLTHLLSKSHHLPAARGRFRDAAAAYWQAYYSLVQAGLHDPELEALAVRHTLGCLLARVAGRSPLEYLACGEQRRQREGVIDLVDNLPSSIPALIDAFVQRIG